MFRSGFRRICIRFVAQINTLNTPNAALVTLRPDMITLLLLCSACRAGLDGFIALPFRFHIPWSSDDYTLTHFAQPVSSQASYRVLYGLQRDSDKKKDAEGVQVTGACS